MVSARCGAPRLQKLISLPGRKYHQNIAQGDPLPTHEVPVEQLSADALLLARSIDARLDQVDWHFVGERETEERGRLLLAACMRHAARLLVELDTANRTGLVFAARMVARTLYETLTLATYLRFFPDGSYDLVRSNFRSRVNEAISAVEKLNKDIETDAKTDGATHIPPPVPTAMLEPLLKDLGTSNAKLPLELMIREVGRADANQGFFRENLRRLHIIYRASSMFAPHTNYWVLKGYFYSETENQLVPTLSSFSGNSTSHMDRLFTIHMTACVAIAVLQTNDEPMKDAHDIVAKYSPMVVTDY